MKGFVCDSLTKRIDTFMLSDISFEINPGMVMGLVGTNGAGKTTLISTILGVGTYRLTEPDDKGEFFLSGYHFMKDVREYRNRIAYIFSEPPFTGSKYPEQIGELYGYYYETFDLEKYRKLLEEYNIPKNSNLEKLSTGQQLKVQLAFALSYDADLYVMDEPAGNLDVDFRDELYQIIRELTAKDKMVILSSHLITELEEIADILLWITKNDDESGVFFQGTIDDLKEEYRMIEADRYTLEKIPEKYVVGKRISEGHSEALVRTCCSDDDLAPDKWIDDMGLEKDTKIRYADLSEIMYYVEKNK